MTSERENGATLGTSNFRHLVIQLSHFLTSVAFRKGKAFSCKKHNTNKKVYGKKIVTVKMGQKCVRGQFAVVTSVNSAPSGLCLLYFPIMTRNGRKGCRAVDYADVASLCAYVYYYKALFHLLWNRVLVVNILLQARLYPKRRSTLSIYTIPFSTITSS